MRRSSSIKSRGKVTLRKQYKSGYLSKVSNPKGKKASIYIAQGRKGFSASYSKTNKGISGSSKSAEGLAIRLAKRGHKIVTFRD